MASFFGHVAVALTSHSVTVARRAPRQLRRALLAIAAATIPDLDALGHWAGVPYDSQWGHRGFTHSLLFAAVLGILYAGVMVGTLPFWMASALFVFAFTAAFEWERGPVGRPRRILEAALLGLGTGLAVSLVFERLFLVRLP